MKKEFSEIDQIIGRADLVEKWIKYRKKEKTLIKIADIYLWEEIHKGHFPKSMLPKKHKEVTKPIIVRPNTDIKGKYILVRGWRHYHIAQIIGQGNINAFITHSNREKFAKKLLRYIEEVEK